MKSVLAVWAMVLALASPAFAAEEHWAAAWAAAPQAATGTVAELDNQTLRQTVRLSLGGSRLQVRLSNEFGADPVRIGAAVVMAGGRSERLTFGGARGATIPPGAPLLSDPVSLAVERMGELTVSLYLPGRTRLETIHLVGSHTALVSTPGDHSEALPAAFPTSAHTTLRALLSGVSVWSAPETRVVAAFGASIVDGFRSSVDADASWPDDLAKRFAARPGPQVSVVNLGIAGNRVVTGGTGQSALVRFDRDVLSQPGLTHVIMLEGFNDLNALAPGAGPAPGGSGAQALMAAYRQLAQRAHQHGVKFILSPVTPSTIAGWTLAKEFERMQLNVYIRQNAALFDGLVDFNAALQNPRGGGIRPDLDSGDLLHPNDAGYRAMAEAVDLKLFEAP